MTFRLVVQNGRMVSSEPTDLPEGTVVRAEVVSGGLTRPKSGKVLKAKAAKVSSRKPSSRSSAVRKASGSPSKRSAKPTGKKPANQSLREVLSQVAGAWADRWPEDMSSVDVEQQLKRMGADAQVVPSFGPRKSVRQAVDESAGSAAHLYPASMSSVDIVSGWRKQSLERRLGRADR